MKDKIQNSNIIKILEEETGKGETKQVSCFEQHSVNEEKSSHFCKPEIHVLHRTLDCLKTLPNYK